MGLIDLGVVTLAALVFGGFGGPTTKTVTLLIYFTYLIAEVMFI